MELSKQKIKQILDSSSYTNLINNKTFYSLKDFVKENNICDFNYLIQTVNNVKQKLANFSHPQSLTFQVIKTSNNSVKEIYCSSVGLMFVLAEISKNVKNNNTKNFCYIVAKYIASEKESYYPDIRALCRIEYTEVTKEFRSKIKKYLESYNKYELSEQIALIYHTILKNYYYIQGNDVKDYLNKLKTNSYNKSYLDFISARELKDLTQIQKMAIKCLENSNKDILQVITNEAQKRRYNFYTKYSQKFPENYAPHTLTPAKMLKEFTNLLIYYKLDAESLKNITINELQ